MASSDLDQKSLPPSTTETQHLITPPLSPSTPPHHQPAVATIPPTTALSTPPITPTKPTTTAHSTPPITPTTPSTTTTPSPATTPLPYPRRPRRRGKFTDLAFTHSFTAFDRHHPAANSPFHGFFTLFWMGVFLFAVKIAADNWRVHGNPLGTNEILRGMMGRELGWLVLADGVMCAAAGVWQTVFIAAVVGLTMWRDWPWTHTVFFVLHGLVMLMKQHSYAFYNGHLSSVYKQRNRLLEKIKELDKIASVPAVPGVATPTASEEQFQSEDGEAPDIAEIVAAIDAGGPLDETQAAEYSCGLKWEVDALSDELRGKSTAPGREYPHNLTFRNHCEYMVLPTVVYELEYPRSEQIDWWYAAEKAAACFGVIFVMIMISQAFIYPVVMDSVRMKEEGVPLPGRFRQFPWMMLDLIFPFMMEYLLTWYLIWETILNFVAELTRFADRGFYDAWWNCVSWDQFARDWNRPVHNFLLRHVYHSSISAMKVDKHTATLITFFLSACVHELVMWRIFKKLRGYLLVLQMCQLPLVRLSRTKWLRNREQLGNIIFWLGIFTGPSILCSLYLIL
ncbi:hypothetical protein C8A05DRAFT_15679 [Staphylotrichum tortipilum]|uniref:O-acyltransferase n=1 Tax=Staphylotrichum tortipilum TaxID=2831512 RepID=A0AAN6ML23_9PEZI|nr:hypothetical protein C8A05DRAFT_15679 [Staphylotrichum longicolle]